MGKYNYLESIISDIKDLIKWGEIETPNEENFDDIYDQLWLNDSVTGNASGSYTFNTYQAEQNLCGNLYLLQEACNEFCISPRLDDAEWCDVTIRCYLLSQALNQVIEDLNEEE